MGPPRAPGRFLPLPSYPWQGKRYWIDEETEASGPKPSLNGHDASNGHPVASNGRHHEPAAEPPSAGDDLFYQIRWNRTDAPAGACDLSGRWVVVGEDGAVARSLAADLEGRGAEVVLASIPPPESLRSARRVVYIAAPGDDVAATAARTCGEVLDLVRALASLPGPDLPRLWVVTRGAQPAGSQSPPLVVEHASLWGLGRSLALEHPEIWGGLIDLDPEADSAGEVFQRRALALAIADGREDQIALRDGQWYVPRLVRREMPATASPRPTFRPEATYLVTGGLGDLGLRVARWMVENGARRLILLGRSGLPDRVEWDGLESSDSRVAAIRAMEQPRRDDRRGRGGRGRPGVYVNDVHIVAQDAAADPRHCPRGGGGRAGGRDLAR